MKCSYCVIMRLVLILFLVVASRAASSGANDLSQLRDAGPGAFADDNTTLAAASLEQTDETDDETDDGPKRNRLFPKVPRCRRFDLQ